MVNKEKIFCTSCGILISQPKGFFKQGGDEYYEFVDGIYCLKCSKIRINKTK